MLGSVLYTCSDAVHRTRGEYTMCTQCTAYYCIFECTVAVYAYNNVTKHITRSTPTAAV